MHPMTETLLYQAARSQIVEQVNKDLIKETENRLYSIGLIERPNRGSER